jgi:hypothetical protein
MHAGLDRMISSSCVGGTIRLGRLLTIHYDALTLLVPALERAGAEHVCPEWEGRSRLAALEEDLRVLRARYSQDPYASAFIREGAGNLGRPLCHRRFLSRKPHHTAPCDGIRQLG